MNWWLSIAAYLCLFLLFTLVAVAGLRGLKEPEERTNWNAEVAVILALGILMSVWVFTRP